MASIEGVCQPTPRRLLRTWPPAPFTAGLIVLCALLVSTDAVARPLYPLPVVEVGDQWADPVGLLATDLDNDGRLDLVAAIFDGDAVSVMLGNGEGTFAPPIIHEIECAFFPTVGDFDADGRKDLAVATCNGIATFIGNGDGTFSHVASYDTTQRALHVGIGDFNEDDLQDLVYVGIFDASVRLGNGDGTFGPEVQIADWQSHSVAVADFNGDGHDDFACSGNYRFVDVRLGNGDGTFDASGPFPAGDRVYWIAAGDLNNDGIPDLAVTNEDSDDLSVLLGNGDGTFAAEQRYAVAPPGGLSTDPWFVAIADLDEDGLLDLVVSNYWSSEAPLALLFGIGEGQFAPFVVGDTTWRAAYSIAIGDFDDDGVKDLARPSYWYRNVGILFGNGDGLLATPVPAEVGELPKMVAVGDLDGDGRLDLVTANAQTNDVSVVLADGAGSFAPENRFAVGNGPVWVAIGELTGDTYPDLAVANGGSGNVSLLQGNGDGTFSGPTGLPVGDLFPATPSSVALGNFNADDHSDLVVTDRQANRIAVLLGNGDGTFGSPTYVPAGGSPSSVIVEDFDGDEIQDLAVSNLGSDTVSVLLGTGDGGFTGAPTLDTQAGPSQVISGDVDRDLKPDLLVVNADADDVQIFLGNGDGTFAPPVETPGFGGTSLAVMDADGDARLDLVSASPSLWLGNGNGSFGPRQRFAYKVFREFVATGDFNLDSRPDLVIASHNSDATSNIALVYLNQGGPRAFSLEADKVTLVWPAVTGALTYNIYRGDLSDLIDGDSYGACMTGLDDDPRDTFFVDPDVPSSGDGYFYLMSVVDAGGDGGLGTTSAGLPRVPAVACP